MPGKFLYIFRPEKIKFHPKLEQTAFAPFVVPTNFINYPYTNQSSQSVKGGALIMDRAIGKYYVKNLNDEWKVFLSYIKYGQKIKFDAINDQTQPPEFAARQHMGLVEYSFTGLRSVSHCSGVKLWPF